jgi:hypothetical protein
MRWVKVQNLTSSLLSIGGRYLKPNGETGDENWFIYKQIQYAVQDMATGEIDLTVVAIIDEINVPDDLSDTILQNVYLSDAQGLRNAQYVWDTGTLSWVRMTQPLVEITGGNFTVEMDQVEAILEAIKDTDGIKKIDDNVTVDVASSVLPTGAATETTLGDILAALSGTGSATSYTFDWTGDELNYIERGSDSKRLNFTWVGGKVTAISDWS